MLVLLIETRTKLEKEPDSELKKILLDVIRELENKLIKSHSISNSTEVNQLLKEIKELIDNKKNEINELFLHKKVDSIAKEDAQNTLNSMYEKINSFFKLPRILRKNDECNYIVLSSESDEDVWELCHYISLQNAQHWRSKYYLWDLTITSHRWFVQLYNKFFPEKFSSPEEKIDFNYFAHENKQNALESAPIKIIPFYELVDTLGSYLDDKTWGKIASTCYYFKSLVNDTNIITTTRFFYLENHNEVKKWLASQDLILSLIASNIMGVYESFEDKDFKIDHKKTLKYVKFQYTCAQFLRRETELLDDLNLLHTLIAKVNTGDITAMSIFISVLFRSTNEHQANVIQLLQNTPNIKSLTIKINGKSEVINFDLSILKQKKVNIDLSFIKFKMLNFSNTYLANLYFYKSSFKHSNLSNSILENSYLEEVNLTEADLTKATLRHAVLTKAKLSRAIFLHANMQNVDLVQAVLSDAHLKHANLTHSNLEGASLRNATMQRCKLWNSNLRNADLRGANMKNCKLSNSDLRGAKGLISILNAASINRITLFKSEYQNLHTIALNDDDFRVFEKFERAQIQIVPDENIVAPALR